MDALTIRRYRGLTTPQFPAAGRTEKPSAAAPAQKTAKSTGLAVSETLRQLMDKVSQTESHIRESHRTLQSGETVLDEVRSSLDRIAELAEKAAGSGEPDREALQKEVEHLRDEIERMISSAEAGGSRLFLDDAAGIEDGLEALLEAVKSGASEEQEGVQTLPDWLVKGLAFGVHSADAMLSALGLDKNASVSQLLAAIADHPLDESPVTGYLATLYLGTVIAGGDPSEEIDPQKAMEGLRMLLEAVQDGASPDEAIEQLTNGRFTSFADFEKQFTGGTAPQLEKFLINALLAGDETALPPGGAVFPEPPSLLALMGGLNGIRLELMTALLDALQKTGNSPDPSSAAAQSGSEAAGMDAATAGPAAAPAASVPANTAVLQMGTVQVMGRDLSGVSFDAASNVLTVNGTADVTIRGTGQGDPVIQLNGSGTVTLHSVSTPALTVNAPAAHVLSTGETVLHEIQLKDGVSLTLDSGGRVETGTLQGSPSNALHLTGGAVILRGKEGGGGEGGKTTALPVPVFLDGPVSFAAHAVYVRSDAGKPLDPLDIIWKTLLPGWNSITSMTVDGRHARMTLAGGEAPDPARLWLAKGDASHGYPVHTVVIRGQDRDGQIKTRYAYLRWDQRAGAFAEIDMYPNPFTVTGGEEGQDWRYDAESHTLYIFSAQVTALSGGLGVDAEQIPFSGRIVLTDGIGAIRLSLDGVTCRVPVGRAFSLGRENDVTLLLESGRDNRFKSGRGYAGISLRDGTSLCIDCAAARSSRDPDGTLTASGGAGGAGIGRDSGAGRDQASRILIRGGVITASGAGGGAGIGAGKHSSMGPVTILGGSITATGGKGGGAGIGGALGAPVGDISIQGGSITAVALDHAAAIGAGMQGASGSILITGSARILKALGGDPGADIGGSLFGGCGSVRIAGGADIGCARLRTQSGIPLRMGETTVTLPQFRLSPRTLRLDRLNVLTREHAQAAVKTIDTDRRWIAQIQSVYSALYTQLEQSRLQNSRQYISMSGGGMVRDPDAASTLLRDMSRSIPLPASQALSTHGKRGTEDVRRLLW